MSITELLWRIVENKSHLAPENQISESHISFKLAVMGSEKMQDLFYIPSEMKPLN